MLAGRSSLRTTGAYSNTSWVSASTVRACAGAMPSSISMSIRSRWGRPIAHATSNRLWLATPTRTAPAHCGSSADITNRLKLASTSALVSYGACGHPCSSASTRSIARFAPFTTRIFSMPPARACRSAAHRHSSTHAACESGRYACNTMPASMPARFGSSSTRRIAAIVNGRSRYSSMSRLTNVAGVVDAAER